MIWIVHKLFHSTMIALGCYFIYQGEVVQKYKSKMTNFALSEENIAELPTIKTWISPLTSQFKLGKDFNITYKSGTEASEMKPVNLSLGNNSIDGDLTVNFQRLPGRNIFQITPANFSPEMSLDHVLVWEFKNEDQMKGKKIGLSLSTEIDVMTCNNYKHFDGEVDEIFSWIGKRNKLKINPEKVIYRKEIRNCRQRPYFEEFNKKFIKNLLQNCTNQCKKAHYLNQCQGLKLATYKAFTILSYQRRSRLFFEHNYKHYGQHGGTTMHQT